MGHFNTKILALEAVLLSVLACVSLSCTRQDPVEPVDPAAPAWDAFDFTARESRKAGTNEFSMDIVLTQGGRDAWYSLTMNVDGEDRRDLSREGRIFTDSEKLSVECGSFRNGRHVFELSMRDKLDSLVTRRVSFNCIGDGEGEKELSPTLSFREPSLSVLVDAEASAVVSVFPEAYRDSVRWSVLGDAAVLVSSRANSAVVRGVAPGKAVLQASVISSRGNAVAVCEITCGWEDETPLFAVSAPEELMEGNACTFAITKDGAAAWSEFSVAMTMDGGDASLIALGDAAGRDDRRVTVENLSAGKRDFSFGFLRRGTPTGQEEALTVDVYACPEADFATYGDAALGDGFGKGRNLFALCMQEGPAYLTVTPTEEMEVVRPDFGACSPLVKAEQTGEGLWRLAPLARGSRSFGTEFARREGMSPAGKDFTMYVWERMGFFACFDFRRSIFAETVINSAQAGFRMQGSHPGLSGDVVMKLNVSAYVDDRIICTCQGGEHVMKNVPLNNGDAHLVSVSDDMRKMYDALRDKGYGITDLNRVWVEALYTFSLNDGYVWMDALGADPVEEFNVITVPCSTTVSIKREIADYCPYIIV